MTTFSQIQNKLDALEPPFRKALEKEKNRYINAVAQSFADGIEMPTYLYRQHERNMQQIMYAGWRRSIRAFAVQNLSKLDGKKQILPNERKGLFDLLFATWVNTIGALRVRQVSETTRNDIRDAILEAEAEAVDQQGYIAKILKAKGLSKVRAATIARTETHQAAMFANKESAQSIALELGLQLKKRWVPALDERTRVNHAVMASKPAIPMDEKFFVGGEWMDRPGDPNVSASNTIRCRCVLTYEEA